MDEQLRRLLRNDMDSTKHTCLYYLAGIIGTGEELEDFFYLMCKTLNYDKNKVLFHYSTYMTVTAEKLFSDSEITLTEDNYEEWIRSRKQHCTSVRTSTCENLCKRKLYSGYDIPSHACSLCKLSPLYKNSRDPLERMVIRYFMDPATPPERIYVNGSEDGFVSVERISPRESAFGRYPVIRFYNYVYDFLFNDTSAASLRSDQNKFNEAAASYIASRLDLSSYDNSKVSKDMVYDRLRILLRLLWNTDITSMKSCEDGNWFADECIMLMHRSYEAIHEGKQMNPHTVKKNDSSGVAKSRQQARKKTTSRSVHNIDLLQMAEDIVSESVKDCGGLSGNVEPIKEQSGLGQSESVDTDTCKFVANDDSQSLDSVQGANIISGSDHVQEDVSVVDDSDVAEISDLPSDIYDELSSAILDCVNFQDADYVPFNYESSDATLGVNDNISHTTPLALKEDAGLSEDCISIIDDDTDDIITEDSNLLESSGQTEITSLVPLQFAPAWRYPYAYGQLRLDEANYNSSPDCSLSFPLEINYLGDIMRDVSAAYRYCIRVPVLASVPGSSGSPVRITDETMLDFLHECAISDYAILLPAVCGMNEEGLLVFLSSSKSYSFFSLSVRGASNLDYILINDYTNLYTSDTLGCINMLVKFGSRIASSSLIGMDIILQQARGVSDRSAVYGLSDFRDSINVLTLPLCMYEVCMGEFGGRGVATRYHYDASRLMCAYRMLFHQRYLAPILSDNAPLFAFDDDLHVRFLFGEGYRFIKRGTLYTIRFGADVTIGGCLTSDSLLCDLLGLFDLMNHRYFHTSRIVHCNLSSISIFLESVGSDAGIFYDMFYRGLETILLNHGHVITQTVTVRTEYS